MSLVRLDREGPVSVVTLDRPERHNSLVPELIDDLGAALVRAAADSGAVVLAAAGRTFSTGGDVRAIREARDRQSYSGILVDGLNRLLMEMIDLPVPIVAAVQGMVTGGSVGLVLASDYVVAAEHVTIRPWYTTIGFSPDGGWTAMMPSVIGASRTRAILLADEEIDAGAAHRWGLVHRVVREGEALPAALDVAGRMAGRQAGSTAAAKRIVWNREAVLDGLAAERREFVLRVVTDEATEGMDRFLGWEAT